MLFLKELTLRKIMFDICVCIIGGSCSKYHFFRDKCFVATNTCLSRQTCVYHDKTRLLSRSRQKYVCRVVATKVCLHNFVATKDVFCREKTHFCRNTVMFVAINICRDKRFVATNNFVATSILLSQQKT